MLLYFLRHASAGKTMLNPKKDERRPLDDEGILQARYMGRLLANLDVQVDQIISSPLTRARQTASLRPMRPPSRTSSSFLPAQMLRT